MCTNDTSSPHGGDIIVEFKGISPKIADNCFIADSAKIIGDVSILDQASIWFNVVLRGDIDKIIIGRILIFKMEPLFIVIRVFLPL